MQLINLYKYFKNALNCFEKYENTLKSSVKAISITLDPICKSKTNIYL